MNINKIQPNINFYSSQTAQAEPKKKHEFIDSLAEAVRNPRDVNDCVAIPRGIFKAYIYLMLGSGLISIANFLPKNWKYPKLAMNVLGCISNIISAVYFAKPFAVKGLSPTISKGDCDKPKQQTQNPEPKPQSLP